MPLRAKLQVALTLLAAVGATILAASLGSASWLPFWLLLGAILFSSGLKVTLPRGDGSMSLNFPFILLGIVQLSPLQAMLLAALSVAAQCRIRVRKIFTAVQILFNVANAMLSTASACATFISLQRAHVALAPALAVASLAYFLWNTLSVAMVLGATKGESVLSLWRKEYPWYLPFYVVGAVLAAAVSLLSLHYGWGTALLLIPLVYTLYRAYMGQVSRLQERQQHLEETEALHLRTIEGLAMAIEAKDQNTHDHLFRVRQYVKAVGNGLKLSKLELQALETAAFLHDIGKLAVPEQIINKPGKLTPDEFEKMKIHPVVGADILERVRFPYPVVPIVRSHHEWWDGTGYPDGLIGEDIPIGARILTVVDCFDALTSDRPYRKGMTDEKALELLDRLSGTQFDPRVVEVFRHCYAIAEVREAAVHAAAFTPLNTEVEVWRGEAPGAGYEAGSESRKEDGGHGREISAPVTLPGTSELQGIAEANTRVLQSLDDLRNTLTKSQSAGEVTDALASNLRRNVSFDACVLYEKKGDRLEARWAEGRLVDGFRLSSLPLGEGISGWVAQTGKPILNANASVEPGCPVAPDGSFRLASAVSIPVFGADHAVRAVLSLYSVRADSYLRENLQTLQQFEPLLSLFLEKLPHCKSQDGFNDIDPVTGLAQACTLALQLEAALDVPRQSGDTVTVLTCRITGLHVLSTRDQIASDRFLRLIAEQFRAQCGEVGLAARVREDVFCFLLPGRVGDEALAFGQRIQATVQHASRQLGSVIPVRSTVSFAVCPADGTSVEDLLAMAERRLHYETQQELLQSIPAEGLDTALLVPRQVS